MPLNGLMPLQYGHSFKPYLNQLLYVWLRKLCVLPGCRCCEPLRLQYLQSCCDWPHQIHSCRFHRARHSLQLCVSRSVLHCKKNKFNIIFVMSCYCNRISGIMFFEVKGFLINLPCFLCPLFMPCCLSLQRHFICNLMLIYSDIYAADLPLSPLSVSSS